MLIVTHIYLLFCHLAALACLASPRNSGVALVAVLLSSVIVLYISRSRKPRLHTVALATQLYLIIILMLNNQLPVNSEAGISFAKVKAASVPINNQLPVNSEAGTATVLGITLVPIQMGILIHSFRILPLDLTFSFLRISSPTLRFYAVGVGALLIAVFIFELTPLPPPLPYTRAAWLSFLFFKIQMLITAISISGTLFARIPDEQSVDTKPTS